MKKIGDDLIKNLYDQGLNDSEISRKLGCNNATISTWRKRFNLPVNFKYKNTLNEKDFLNLYNQNYRDGDISRELNVSYKAVEYLRKKLKLPVNNKHLDIILTSDQQQVIIGGLLGDSSMTKQYKNAILSFRHTLPQEEYADYKAKLLDNLISGSDYEDRFDKRTGKTYSNKGYWTKCHQCLNYYYDEFYKTGKKIIPKKLINNINELGLAIWFMDDGTRTSCSYSIATNSFSLEDIKILQNILLNKFNIKSSIHSNNVLYILAESKDLFTKLIENYFPQCMKYKLIKKSQVLIKQGELQENLEADNLQPSLGSA